MKKIVLLVIFCCALFSADLTQMRADLKNGISGKFIQTKHIFGFLKPIKTSGDFSILNGEMIWRVKSPVNSELKITKYGVFTLLNNQWQKTDTNIDSQLLIAIFNLDEDRLKDSFDINISEENGEFKVLLVPKTVILKQIFTKIVIVAKTHIKSVLIQEVSGDKTISEFYDIKP